MGNQGILQSTPEMDALLKLAVHFEKPDLCKAAQRELAKALELPLRQGIFPGNIVDGIFQQAQYKYGQLIEYPVDCIAPGTEKEYVAFTIPGFGKLPDKFVEGDYVAVPTYEIGAAMSITMRYARDANWDVVGRLMTALEAQIVKKMNDDAWHLLIATAADRNIMVYDSNANSGQFTKRLISLAKTVMRRNGGGNSTSINRGKLTDIFISPEGQEDMRNWGLDQIDEVTRREIYLADDNSDKVQRVFSVNLHDMDELGEGQEYQNYFLNELGGSLTAGDLELLIGLDLSKNDSFVNPVRAPFSIIENDHAALQRAINYFGIADVGWGCLDNRRTISMSM